MKNRSIIARELAAKAKQPENEVVEPVEEVVDVVEEVKVEEPTTDEPEEEKELIQALDPETKEVVLEFESFDDAEESGFRGHNIKSSLSTGNKYKGHLWELSK